MGHPALLVIVGKSTHTHTHTHTHNWVQEPVSFDKIFVHDRQFSMFSLSEAEHSHFGKSYNKGD